MFALLRETINSTQFELSPKRIDLVVIDSLNNLVDLDRGEQKNPAIMIDQLIEFIKGLAVKNQVPVLATFTFLQRDYEKLGRDIAFWDKRRLEVFALEKMAQEDTADNDAETEKEPDGVKKLFRIETAGKAGDAS